MKGLELKIPPVVVALICIAINYLGRHQQWAMFRQYKQFDAWVIIPLLLGMGIALWGVLEFRRARTTVNPHTPERASSIVSSGIFRYTRNPMYLGIVLVLIAVTVYLGSFVGVFSTILFMLYINRFQIVPEEREMERLFGSDYAQYKQKVRRWF